MTSATVFRGGRVWTGEGFAEALLVEDGRVAAVGEEASVRRRTPTGAERVDLAGGLVVPGLADAHLHLAELTRVREAWDAGSARSVAELLERFAAYAAGRGDAPVVAMGLSVDALAERRWPTRLELDRALGDRPALVFQASGHAAVASSAALAAAGSAGPTPVSGLLREEELRATAPLVDRALPLGRQNLGATARALGRFGLTTVGAMSVGDDELALLGELAAAGELPLRVRAYPTWVPADASASAGRLDPRVRVAVAGVKTFLDGAFGPRTAALEEPYADDPSTRGVERGDDRALTGLADACERQGLTLAVHAIGDRAVARAARLLARPGLSGRVEHASLTPPPVVDALGRLRPWTVVQPGFVLSDPWLGDRLGPERARWAYAFRSLLDAGVPLAGSSDAPFDAPDPWHGMRAAVERRDRLGRSANASSLEALPVEEAFGLYGRSAHRALGLPFGGHLAEGAPADLVVLRTSTLAAAVRRGASCVRATWSLGEPLADPPRPDEGHS
jgi:predicted amidohydrolase YtcJ